MCDQIIQLSGDECEAIFMRHFGLRLRVFAVTDDEEGRIGFGALIGDLGAASTDHACAADAWNSLYSFRVFSGVGDVILTFMDVLMEQQGK